RRGVSVRPRRPCGRRGGGLQTPPGSPGGRPPIPQAPAASKRCRSGCHGNSVRRRGQTRGASRTPGTAVQTLPHFEVLFDAARAGVPLALSPALESAHGGGLWLPSDCVISNFVESVDGVVAFSNATSESGGIVSGGSEADRFLMGLLRACVDAVLIGAGTLRAAPGDLWFPESIHPAAAPLYAELRRSLGI